MPVAYNCNHVNENIEGRMNEDNTEGKPFRAASMLRRVSANDVSTLLRDAFGHFEKDQFTETQKLCDQALTQDSQNFEVHQLMAMACFHAGDRTKAITHFETCVTLQPENPQAHYFLGNGMAEEGRLAEAEASYRRVIELEPGYAEAFTNLASMLQMQDRIEEAIPFYEKSLKLNPESITAISNLAIALQAQGRTLDSIAQYKKAIELEPNTAFLHFNLGVMQESLGSWQDATNSYQRAIELEPDHFEAIANLAILFHESGSIDKAVPLYRQASAANPENPELNHKLALGLREHGQIDEAIQVSQNAIANNQANPHSIIELSLALIEKGETQAAIDNFLEPTRVLRTVGAKVPQNADTFDVINRSKINHDIDQLTYLVDRNILSDEYRGLIGDYQELQNRLTDSEETRLSLLKPPASDRLSSSYNRMIHMADAPALPDGAVNPGLDRAAIEKDFSLHDPGFTYFDDLLTPQAIDALRQYCLESTFWYDVHYNGDVGAGIENGFCSPLVLQIAQEMRDALPDILGPHQFSSCWTYKYMESVSGLSTHADDGAVSINFWITPDEANLNPETGGIEFWNKKAPYNYFGKPHSEKIIDTEALLKEPDAESVYVPYKCNRAMVFHSNVFHNTAPIDFKDGYENKRINLTFIYGRPRLEAQI
jgi:tetratricopeptide (TPR) repeat protein